MAFSVNCPSCAQPLDVDDEYRDWKVRCPHCGHEFHPTATATPDDEPRRSRRPRRRDDDDFDDDDDDFDVRSATASVSGPANGLKFVGWFGIVLSPLGVALWLLLLVMALNAPPGQQNAQNGAPQRDEIITQAAIYIPQGIICFVLSVVIVIGAGKLSRLESRGWATTAAVLSMVPCLSPCCLLGLPFGIMALSAINRPNVQAAFRRNERRRNSRYHDD